MVKIVRPVSLMLMSVALCTTGTAFASSETIVPEVGISQQQSSVKGVVEDALGPVVGASVVVKGTTNGTVTDMDGNFELNVNKGDVIVISYIVLGISPKRLRTPDKPLSKSICRKIRRSWKKWLL